MFANAAMRVKAHWRVDSIDLSLWLDTFRSSAAEWGLVVVINHSAANSMMYESFQKPGWLLSPLKRLHKFPELRQTLRFLTQLVSPKSLVILNSWQASLYDLTL